MAYLRNLTDADVTVPSHRAYIPAGMAVQVDINLDDAEEAEPLEGHALLRATKTAPSGVDVYDPDADPAPVAEQPVTGGE